MFDFTWQQAFAEASIASDASAEVAFKAGWSAALAQIIGALEDEYKQVEGREP